MALALYFAPPSMSAAQYDEIMRRLKGAGAGNPAGRSYHACFGEGNKLQVFDVWDSQASFDAFGATLMPIFQQMGFDAGQPVSAVVQNVVVPPARAARPKAKARVKIKPKARARKPARSKGKKVVRARRRGGRRT